MAQRVAAITAPFRWRPRIGGTDAGECAGGRGKHYLRHLIDDADVSGYTEPFTAFGG